MQGIYMRIYVPEQQRHDGVLLYEWLLEEAKRMGIGGGSAFRAIAGFGRHGVMHEQGFFELAGSLPVEVGFLLSEGQAERLLGLLEENGLQLFYVKVQAEYGIAGAEGG